MAASFPRVYRTLSQMLKPHKSPYFCPCRFFTEQHSPEKISAVSFTKRSHLCGDLRASHANEEVILCGWLQYHRLSGTFIVLRDWCGMVQLILPENKVDEYRRLPLESVLGVKGVVKRRPTGQENKNMPTGEVEIAVEDITVLNTSAANLPFGVQSFHKVNEATRIKYRYLDLRLPSLQNVLRTRSKFVMSVRQFLANDNGFVEVETPTLFRRTPGGAREFLVPTHIPGKFYSLPQSPQQFKQLLMVGGLDRYFQIARCYRDEGTRPDRQPEFTQIDLEMSFVSQDEVISLVENMLEKSWPEGCGRVQIPFPRMNYQEAMLLYGCDKPDLRFDWQITEIAADFFTNIPPVFQASYTNKDSSVQALRIPQACIHLSNKEIDAIKEMACKEVSKNVKVVICKIKEDGTWGSGLGRHIDDISKNKLRTVLGLKPTDLLVMAAGDHFQPHEILGQMRLKFADLLESKGVTVRGTGFHFLWVENFPLFLPKEDGEEGLESAHHPFTAPHPDDVELVYTTPEHARSQHYDLVLNGSEIGGGSIRIHDSRLQSYVLTEILKEDPSELDHLLDALGSGCPPHGGIALGLDRLMSIMCGTNSIRDVIAFPKTTEGKDLLSNAPAAVSKSDLDYYHIKLNVDKLNKSPGDDGS